MGAPAQEIQLLNQPNTIKFKSLSASETKTATQKPSHKQLNVGVPNLRFYPQPTNDGLNTARDAKEFPSRSPFLRVTDISAGTVATIRSIFNRLDSKFQ